MVTQCCVCSKIEQNGEWVCQQNLPGNELVSHGYCPDCFIKALQVLNQLEEQKTVFALPGAGSLPASLC